MWTYGAGRQRWEKTLKNSILLRKRNENQLSGKRNGGRKTAKHYMFNKQGKKGEESLPRDGSLSKRFWSANTKGAQGIQYKVSSYKNLGFLRESKWL